MMRLPRATQSVARGYGASIFAGSSQVLRNGVNPQGCNVLQCADAIGRCVSSGDVVQCILGIAPNCLPCVQQ